MIAVACKALAARRARTLLTCLAIVLGVGMVTAALTLSDTLRHAANSLTSSSYRGTDAVVDARTAFTVSPDGDASRPTIDASLLQRVRALPQVGTAVGDLTNTQTKVIDTHGSVIGRGPYFGVGFDARRAGRGTTDAVPAEDRPFCGCARSGCDRRRHRVQAARRRRRTRPGHGARAGPHVHGVRDRDVRRRQLNRRGDVHDLRSPDGAATVRRDAVGSIRSSWPRGRQ